ncbi:translational activator of cytochrome c oxidase 1-like isoform X1 [Narcine bancroftii]|uniref:translational activator of cytochrome c oxidase 1-like isoform X1 n=1 Tax=Narcine bancroftii TaxID=1343680 RepID=UPI003831163D
MARAATLRSVCLWNRSHSLLSLWKPANCVAKHRVQLLASIPICLQASCYHCLPVPRAEIHLSAASCAGHNKWSKVKHIKGPKDSAKSQMFAKLSNMLRFAVKGNKGIMKEVQILSLTLSWQISLSSAELRTCRKHPLKLQLKKSKASIYSLYEARGPGGSSLLIEVLTDSNTRTLQQLKSILNKNGGVMSDGARHCFEKKGVVTVNGWDQNGQDIQLERALELAIESGAEDVKQVEDEEDRVLLKFVCDLSSLQEVWERLNAHGLQIVHFGPEFIATTTVQLTEEDLEAAFCLIELINENQDVMKVYDNVNN